MGAEGALNIEITATFLLSVCSNVVYLLVSPNLLGCQFYTNIPANVASL